MASALVTKAFIRQILAASKAATITFAAALNAVQLNAYSVARSGRIPISVAANGQTFQFALPTSGGSLGELGVLELTEEILQRYTNASDYLTETGIDTPTDDQITTQMLADMEPLRHAPADFSGMIR